MLISFFVEGVPAPKGSGRAMRSYSTGKVIYRPASSDAGEAKLKAWDAAVRAAALGLAPEVREAMRKARAVAVGVDFALPRPKRHYASDGLLRGGCAGEPHVVKPDLDKLVRSTIDGLVALFGDDNKVCKLLPTEKRYAAAGKPGALLTVEALS